MTAADSQAATTISKTLADLSVGDTVYWFDVNRRVYTKDASGHSTGGPIWRQHWRKVEVIGETARRWLLSHYAGKIPKKGPTPRGFSLCEREIDRAEWVEKNKHKLISHLTQRVDNYDVLKQIAALIGYQTNEQS